MSTELYLSFKTKFKAEGTIGKSCKNTFSDVVSTSFVCHSPLPLVLGATIRQVLLCVSVCLVGWGDFYFFYFYFS